MYDCCHSGSMSKLEPGWVDVRHNEQDREPPSGVYALKIAGPSDAIACDHADNTSRIPSDDEDSITTENFTAR